MFEAFIQYLISNNIPEYTILILLYLPIVSTLITFSRYIMGWRSLSAYSTVLLVFALLELSHIEGGSFNVVRGLTHGSLITLSLTAIAIGFESIARDVRLHYLSKMSIITTVITTVVFFMLYVAAEIGAANFIRISPISFIIMILVLDIYVKSFIRKGYQKAISRIIKTIVLTFVIFAIVGQTIVQVTVLAYPEIALLSIIINLFLGSWRQLRLSEYIRFKDINLKQLLDDRRNSEQN